MVKLPAFAVLQWKSAVYRDASKIHAMFRLCGVVYFEVEEGSEHLVLNSRNRGVACNESRSSTLEFSHGGDVVNCWLGI